MRSVFDFNFLHRSQLEQGMQALFQRLYNNKKGIKILDVGCGCGPYKDFLLNFFDTWAGIDPFVSSPEITRAPGEQMPFSDNSFDCVFSSQMLEHCEDPHTCIKEMHRVLIPGSLLVCSTHGTFPFHPSPEDHWRWTQTGLVKAFNKAAQFSSVAIIPIGGTFSCLALLNAWYLQILIGALSRKVPIIGPLFAVLGKLLVGITNTLGLLLDKLLPSLSDIKRESTMFLGFFIVARKAVV